MVLYDWYVWLSWWPMDFLRGTQPEWLQRAIVIIAGVYHRIYTELPALLLILWLIYVTEQIINEE